MLFIHVYLVLIGIGVSLWLVNAYLPLDAKIKKILDIVLVIAVVTWRLRSFGILDFLSGIRVGRLIYSGTSLFQRTTRGKEGKDEGSWSPPSLTLQKLPEVEKV